MIGVAVFIIAAATGTATVPFFALPLNYQVSAWVHKTSVPSLSTSMLCPYAPRIRRKTLSWAPYRHGMGTKASQMPLLSFFVHIGMTFPSDGTASDYSSSSVSMCSCFSSASSSSSPSQLFLDLAMDYIQQRQPELAFDALAEAYTYGSSTPGLQIAFESCLRLKIDIATEAAPIGSSSLSIELFQDRLGLASILIDAERYEEAAEQLRAIVIPLTDFLDRSQSTLPSSSVSPSSKSSSPNVEADGMVRKMRRDLLDKASSMLYRSEAAACRWDDWQKNGGALRLSLHRCFAENESSFDHNVIVPPLHPFEALKFACISLEDATRVASLYSFRAFCSVLRVKEGEGSITTETITKGHRDEFNEAYRAQHLLSLLQTPPAVVYRKTVGQRHQGKLKPHGGGRIAGSSNHNGDRLIHVGYISPDFTGRHPLAFLMQDVFHRHDRSKFRIHIYSLSPADGSEEVAKIKSGADLWTVLPQSDSAYEMAQIISCDRLDILIDLCGHAGTSTISEIMASRIAATIQVSYMGFPGSSGSSTILHDYLICDETVIPPPPSSFTGKRTSSMRQNIGILRSYYAENLLVMPHCYFVNSHEMALAHHSPLSSPSHYQISEEMRSHSRRKYNLPSQGFVFCCHNRPDKIDPITFRSWMKALSMIRAMGRKRGVQHEHQAVLWLLKSGNEMEHNLRKVATEEFDLEESALVFCNIVPRQDHLTRLHFADLFLDTPSYNAHTLGCDALYAGVPMLSLLRPDNSVDSANSECGRVGTKDSIVLTEKWASRVGASLIKATSCGLEEYFVVPNMTLYVQTMIRCAQDRSWFNGWRAKLRSAVWGEERGGIDLNDKSRICPLFDTERWVKNLEVGLCAAVSLDKETSSDNINADGSFMAGVQRRSRDIIIVDDNK